MDSPKPALDLERELTCSICTELLYQPLTLLDCLHTYCGACLKDWFSFQAQQGENSPTPPTPGTNIFTCPSCRAPVRDTRHNATVATLLDMFVAANPDRRRSESDVVEMVKKYKRGDQVLPEVKIPERTPEERRAEEEERRLLENVREMSLRDAGVDSSSGPRHRRRREDSSSADGRTRRSRDHSRDSRHTHRHEGSRRPRDDEGRLNGDQLQPDSRSGEQRRRQRSESRHRAQESSDMRRRQIEHQSSLRSLISSSDLSERDVQKEIEDFARQIQEEGLLDGLDLDNIDLSQNDELSRKITEAYRRRQRERERTRAEGTRRRDTSGQSRHSPDRVQEIRSSASDSSRPSSRQRPHSRSTSATGFPEDRSRPPLSQSALHLEVRPEEGRRRRRTSSGGRSATTPLPATQSENRVATRSQTDLSSRTNFGEAVAPRTVFTEARSSSTPSVPTTMQSPTTTSPAPRELTFANRMTNSSAAVPSNFAASPPIEPLSPRLQRPNRPADLSIISQVTSGPVGLGLGLGIGSPTNPGHQRTRSQLYPEPSITCARCAKQHIEYELHYNCGVCASGNWNICIDCYRSGKGCLHWFGFGYGAWAKWEKARHTAREDIPTPHMLTANRYLQPKIIPGGAEGRRTLTTDDPMKRLESGNFCARCLTWANECFWRCDICNFGDWGFCNNCVNQGRSCTHPLLPLTYQPQSSHTPPASPRSPQPPHSAVVLTGPNIHNIGPFKPLTFTTHCDVCQDPISPSHSRYHCFTCTSSIEPDTLPGDYDICTNCYANLEARDQISPENGHVGWRRCLNGHRMIVVGFRDGPGGQLRHILSDLVGGRNLRITQPEGSDEQAPQKWWWHEGGQTRERFVTRDVAADAPMGDGLAQGFPADGGVGMRAIATWAWYPKAEDELLFPKGAEIREIEDVNGDWFFGVYMGAKGLFPSPSFGSAAATAADCRSQLRFRHPNPTTEAGSLYSLRKPNAGARFFNTSDLPFHSVPRALPATHPRRGHCLRKLVASQSYPTMSRIAVRRFATTAARAIDPPTAYSLNLSRAQGVVKGLTGAIGNTPLIRLNRLSSETGCEVLGKAEFMNPGGSVKDRAALYVVKDAEERGLLKPGGTVVEGTAGNTGIGLAHVCRSRGYKLVIYMPNTQSQGKIDLLRLLGAEVYPVPAVAFENPENYNHQAKRHAEALDNAVWTNQFDNTANRRAHIETTGPEIWEQTAGKIDAFTCATGTAGTLAGTTRYLKDVSGGRVKSFLADPPGSVLHSYVSSGGQLVERSGSSITEGIGQGRITDNLKPDIDLVDGSLTIADEKSIEMVYRCLDEEGLYLGASSALNVVAAKEVAEKLGKGNTVVTILCDGAYRYADRLFSRKWLSEKKLLGAIPKHLEKYIVLP
ncbi:hypothetical protein CORC01_12340 [Colletotrichum orchidophilum]|uniref:Cysteine synthase 1 n=1 Tax=Colletotrichum orchidophilum TaxID=1209926 RepID=A0A1G4ATA2_9PEZI|nr:uncharacterized protein CORC01_12340 [Colletotrichum orchidophilum]OHE92345.1 hypothetical protein CORC01_12340 [Colletotrichum orchidophilum]